LVDAIKGLNEYILIFMGMGNDIYELMQYVKTCELDDQIFFKDAVNPEDIVENIASADIGIQPFHYSENIYNEISNKLLECIMAELPTIGVNFPEIENIILGHNIGFVYESENIEQLRHILKHIANNRSILTELKENCKKIKKLYSWEVDEKILIEKVRSLQ
jgi:glycosyltransferase involved in cell wall biosynthesis